MQHFVTVHFSIKKTVVIIGTMPNALKISKKHFLEKMPSLLDQLKFILFA